MDDACTRPGATVRNGQKCFECLLLHFFFWYIMHCTISAMCIYINPEKERILVTAITLCKTTALSQPHTCTD